MASIALQHFPGPGGRILRILRYMWTAIIREVSACISDCELSFVPRTPIDAQCAAAQHAAYGRALESLGCEVIALPAESTMPDAVFIEDVAVVLDEVAVMTRPGAHSRRAEVTSVAALLGALRPLRTIQAPGTLDGGDVLRLGQNIFVGQGARSNAAGISQLQELLAPFGYRVHRVPTRQCLHLKSAVTQVAPTTLLIQTQWVDASAFADYALIAVDPAEPHAANALRVGEGVIYPACFARTARRLTEAGIALTMVDLSELQKAEGAMTCCSLVLRQTMPAAIFLTKP